MEKFHTHFSCLDLSIAMPGFMNSSSGEMGGSTMKGLDINQMPSSGTDEEEEESMEEDEDEGPNGGPAPRKKLRLTKEQSYLLEQSFTQNHTLNLREKEVLAGRLQLKPRQVEVWFQNRRARSKLKQTETECKYLKRWFGSLTEQNRRLQKEVEELRAIKVGHHHHRRLSPPLTMCPRCERVTAATNSKLPSFLRQRQTYASCYD